MQRSLRIMALITTFALAFINNAQGQEEKIMFLGAWDRSQPILERAATETGFIMRWVGSNDISRLTSDELIGFDVVFILNLNPADVPHLHKCLSTAHKQKSVLKVLPLDIRDTQKELKRAELLKEEKEIRKYWRYHGLENLKRMLIYTRVRYLGGKGEILPPIVIPDFGLYHPAATEFFTDVESFTRWLRTSGRLTDGAPRVALMVQQSFIVTGDTKVYASVISEFERRGANAAVIFASDQSRLQTLLTSWKPEILIDDAHASPAVLKGATDLDVPQMKEIAMLRSTIAEWEASSLGLAPHDVSLHLLTQEVYGIIEPNVVGGLTTNITGYRIHEPIPDRVRHMVDRAMSWLFLRRKKNAEKKIAIIYYNKYLGQGDMARGSPSGAFLDGPESLVRFLRAMREHGYTLSRVPKDAGELLQWMKSQGRNIGVWAFGDLEKLVTTGSPVLIPASTYEKWFQELSEKNRKLVVEKFGPTPGNQMVWTENENQFIVLPYIDLGNIILLPQPARGPENDERLLHSRDTPPPHQYLAFYWWLQKEFKADALIHFGTHGSELLLPTKAAGLSQDDFGDICLGQIPNINPWILDNAAEGTLAKRRAYAVLVDHLTPPLEGAGLSGDLRNLHDNIDKFDVLEPGLLKEKYRNQISESAWKADMAPHKDGLLNDQEIGKLAEKLHDIHNQIVPTKLHIMGEIPEEKHLIQFIVSMLGVKFLNELGKAISVPKEEDRFGGDRRKWLRAKAENIVKTMICDNISPQDALQVNGGLYTDSLAKHLELVKVYLDRFTKTPNEIEYVMRALDGKFVPPGPANDPVRNPSAIPTGRNLYAINPEEIPTKAAWEVAVPLVDELLKTRKVRKIAFDLNAFETMRDFGVMEAQILYLMGLRPVWDVNNLAIDVELIPKDVLKRPRIDVFIAISGTMRDNFPSRIELLDKAIRIVSVLDEPDNYVREGTIARREKLYKQGFSAQRVDQLAPARIFGQKPGEYGTKILYLVPKSGAWEKEKEITDVYMENMSYVFTQGLWGEKVDGLYESAIQGSEMILRTWASNMLSPLSNHHVYEYTGGLNMAVNAVTGKDPEIILNDVRDEPKLRNFEDALQVEFHATLLNEKWARGMMEHDYAGAGMMAELVKNTFGWRVTRPASISNTIWNEIHAVYVKDKYNLKIRNWMDRVNPHSFQEIAATLLEAHRKGYWHTDAATIESLAHEYAESVSKYRESGGLVGGGNLKLQQQVCELLNAPGNKPLVEAYRAEVTRAKGDPSQKRVAGQKLETPVPNEKEKTPMSGATGGAVSWTLLAICIIILFFFGFWKKAGIPR